MKYLISFITLFLLISAAPRMVHGQSAEDSNNFKQQFQRHFDYSSRVLSLAKAMPADTYDWKPADDVFSVAKVFAHIARYNFYYLESSLGIPAPQGVDVQNMEALTAKEDVVAALESSIAHVKSSISQMPTSKLSEQTQLYGQTVNGQAVLMQLITHYSEHVGQAIAYARMNDIVPPWNR